MARLFMMGMILPNCGARVTHTFLRGRTARGIIPIIGSEQ
jgi:hypothetical protein